jgi:tetratricopeptide (TPR) repeat protein
LNVKDSATAWSFPFDEKYTDVLALEDSISEKVAKSILPQFSGEDARILGKRGTNNPQAFEAFMKARFYWNQMTGESLVKATRFYEEAIALDPNYALAFALLAEIYIFFGIQCLMPFAECSVKAKAAAEKALAIDPHLAEAQVALGFAILNGEHDWEKGVAYFRRAVETNPDSPAGHFWMETYYLQMRQFDDALAEAKKVREIEPHAILGWHLLAWIYFHYKQYERSIAAHAQMLANPSPYSFGYMTYSWALRLNGDYAEAIAQAQKAIELTPTNPMYQTALAAAYAAAGKRAEAEKELDEILRISAEKYVSPYLLATIYMGLENRDKAFEQLKKATEIHDTWTHWIAVDPQFEALHDDPRYDEIMRLIKHPLAK